MTTMISEVYDALKSAGAPDDQAHAAATALADNQSRFARVEMRLKALQWIVVALVAAMAFIYFEPYWAYN